VSKNGRDADAADEKKAERIGKDRIYILVAGQESCRDSPPLRCPLGSRMWEYNTASWFQRSRDFSSPSSPPRWVQDVGIQHHTSSARLAGTLLSGNRSTPWFHEVEGNTTSQARDLWALSSSSLQVYIGSNSWEDDRALRACNIKLFTVKTIEANWSNLSILSNTVQNLLSNCDIQTANSVQRSSDAYILIQFIGGRRIHASNLSRVSTSLRLSTAPDAGAPGACIETGAAQWLPITPPPDSIRSSFKSEVLKGLTLET
jgi:hypothetical protein